MSDLPPEPDGGGDEADGDDGRGEGTAITRLELGQLPETYRVFHDLRVPGTAEAIIDHLVVGPTGVWLIGTMVWTAPFPARSRRLWRPGTPLRDEVETVQWQAERAGARLGTDVNAVLCCVGTELARPTQMIDRVRVVTADALAQHLSAGPSIMLPAQIAELDPWARSMQEPSLEEPDRRPAATNVALRTSAPPIWRSQRPRTGRAAPQSRRVGMVVGCLIVLLLLLVVAALAVLALTSLARQNRADGHDGPVGYVVSADHARLVR